MPHATTAKARVLDLDMFPHMSQEYSSTRTRCVCTAACGYRIDASGCVCVCRLLVLTRFPQQQKKRDDVVCGVGGPNGSVSRDRRTVMCVGTLRFAGEIMPI